MSDDTDEETKTHKKPKSILFGIMQGLLGAAVAGAWGMWWSDRGRISQLENEKAIMQDKIKDQNDVIWRELLKHDSMLTQQQKDVIEIKTTKEIILSIAKINNNNCCDTKPPLVVKEPAIEPKVWQLPKELQQQTPTAPLVVPPEPIKDPTIDIDQFEQKAAEIDSKTLDKIIRQKGVRYQQQQQMPQQQQQQGK